MLRWFNQVASGLRPAAGGGVLLLDLGPGFVSPGLGHRASRRHQSIAAGAVVVVVPKDPYDAAFRLPVDAVLPPGPATPRAGRGLTLPGVDVGCHAESIPKISTPVQPNKPFRLFQLVSVLTETRKTYPNGCLDRVYPFLIVMFHCFISILYYKEIRIREEYGKPFLSGSGELLSLLDSVISPLKGETETNYVSHWLSMYFQFIFNFGYLGVTST